MFKYARYFGNHALIWSAAIGLFSGGRWYWFGFIAGVIIWIGGDALSRPVDVRSPNYAYPKLLDAALYSLFPALLFLCFAFAWSLADNDLLGFGEWLDARVDRDLFAARAASTWIDYLGGCLSFGLAIAMGGILTAHELGHRTSDPIAMWFARWMLAMAFNASLEVAHVFGHHREVGTPADPATARRGENIYHFYVRSTVGQFFQACRIERERLANMSGLSMSWNHKVIRGLLRAGLVAGLFYLAGGWFALGAFLIASLWNKFLLESLNYLEHYGLVRKPGTPIEPRHAWDSASAFSHAALFNLPFHADHHSRIGVHYPELVANSTAPTVAHGYLGSLPLIWIPPLWRKLIAPRLAEWDANRASPAEKEILAVAR